MPNKIKTPVPNYKGRYSVTRSGKVWSNLTNKFIKSFRSGGYWKVSLYLDGVKKNEYVHRLIALTFIPNPHNYPQVMHIHGNTANNAVTNLQWGNAYKNNNHKHTRKAHMRAVVKLNRYTMAYIARYNSCECAARLNGGKSSSGISRACANQAWTAYGFRWMYEEDYNCQNQKLITKGKNAA